MEAHQRFYCINIIRTITSLYVLLIPLVVLQFTDNLIVVVGAVCLGRISAWAAHVAVCLRTLPSLRRGARFEPAMIRPLIAFGGWMTAVNIINPLMVQMDRFLIGGMVSAAAVAYYTTPQELITRAWFLSNAVLGVMFPAFATSFVLDRARTAEIFGRCLAHVGLILFPITLVTIALSREILTAWLGSDFANEGTRVLQWLALGVFLNGMAQVPSALAVPTSAVTTLGDQHTVTVFDGTTTSTTRVQIGAIGATWTQVTSGVTAGQRVVVADLDEPLPSSATTATTGTNSRGGFGLPGGAPGGFPAGGPPSGGAPGR
jgi:hypothetical protein